MASYIRHTLVFISLAELFPVPSDSRMMLRGVVDMNPWGCGFRSTPMWVPASAGTSGADTDVGSGFSRNLRCQDGILVLNLLLRAASVVSHLISSSVPRRKRSIHSGGSTEKSIL